VPLADLYDRSILVHFSAKIDFRYYRVVSLLCASIQTSCSCPYIDTMPFPQSAAC